ncbi:MAG: ArnT family glycosyltransferase [Dehalococcoidia bacterium]
MMAIQPVLRRPEPATDRLLPRAAEIAVVVLLVLTLRLPSLFEPHHYGDEGVFAATAQQMLAGDTLYREIWDNKPPLVFLIYAAVIAAAGPSIAALHLTGAIWSAATALVVLAIGRRVGGEVAGWLAALLYAVVASLPMIEGTLLLTEHLMVLPAALAALLTLQGAAQRGRRRDRLIAGAGVALGIACLFKQVAIFDAAAAGLWLICLRGRPRRDAAVLVLGWATPVMATALWFAASGALGSAWEALVGSYNTYLGEGSALPAGFQILRLLPTIVALGWLLWRRRRGQVDGNDLLLIWLSFTVLGATTGGRPFGHYLIQVVAPLVLVTVYLTPRPPSLAGKGVHSSTEGASISSGNTDDPRSILVDEDAPFPAREGGAVSAANRVRYLVLSLTLLTLITGFRGFWFSHPTLTPDYYGNWLAFVTGNKTRDEHDRFSSWRVSNQQHLLRMIESDKSSPTLYIWGEYPWLYSLLDAENAAPFSTAYQTAILPGSKELVMRAIERDPPRYIAQELEEWRRLPGLAEFLAARYERVSQIDNTVLWRRVER